MQDPTDPTANAAQRFRITGDVGAAVFAPWIARHAGRLGLRHRLLSHDSRAVELLVSGPRDLLDAMALGCSLGPREVLVDVVQRLQGNWAEDMESLSTSAGIVLISGNDA